MGGHGPSEVSWGHWGSVLDQHESSAGSQDTGRDQRGGRRRRRRRARRATDEMRASFVGTPHKKGAYVRAAATPCRRRPDRASHVDARTGSHSADALSIRRTYVRRTPQRELVDRYNWVAGCACRFRVATVAAIASSQPAPLQPLRRSVCSQGVEPHPSGGRERERERERERKGSWLQTGSRSPKRWTTTELCAKVDTAYVLRLCMAVRCSPGCPGLDIALQHA